MPKYVKLVLAAVLTALIGVSPVYADQLPANGVLSCQQISVGTGTAIPAAALAGRKSIVIENVDAAKTLFLGGVSSVSSTTGLAINAGASITMTIGPIPTIFGTSSAGSLTADICELS